MAPTSDPQATGATAVAHANIALAKYWGKRDTALNVPAVPSVSITLEALWSRTTVTFRDDLETDVVRLGSEGAAAATTQQIARVSRFLDRVRAMAGLSLFADVRSENNFPTGAGLASSASGFAALALAATRAAEHPLSSRALSRLARQGSGSAARSVFGGFVEMRCVEHDEGIDAFAEPLAGPDYWPLWVVVAITAEHAKDVGSTEGMERSRRTSPYYAAWQQSAVADVQACREAVRVRDFEALAEVSEHSCLKMHGLMLSSKPALVYWEPATLEALRRVTALRRQGVAVFSTIDAGPQVKAVCLPEACETVSAALASVPGVVRIVRSPLGPGAHGGERGDGP